MPVPLAPAVAPQVQTTDLSQDILRPLLSVEARPAESSQQAAVVLLLHGFGDSARGMQDLAEHWAAAAPHVKFILPTAQQGSWFSTCGNTRVREEHREELLRLLEGSGAPLTRVVIMGFSQGAGMAALTALQLSAPCAGLVLLAPKAGQLWLSEAAKLTPVLCLEGADDRVVPPAVTRDLRERLRAAGLMVDYSEIPGQGHMVGAEMVSRVQDFLLAKLPRRLAVQAEPAALAEPYVSGGEDVHGVLRPANGARVDVCESGGGVIRGYCPTEEHFLVELDSGGTEHLKPTAFTQRLAVQTLSTSSDGSGFLPSAVSTDCGEIVGVEAGKDGGAEAYIVRRSGEGDVALPTHRLLVPANCVMRLAMLGTDTERAQRLDGHFCRVEAYFKAEGRYSVRAESGEVLRVRPRQLWP